MLSTSRYGLALVTFGILATFSALFRVWAAPVTNVNITIPASATGSANVDIDYTGVNVTDVTVVALSATPCDNTSILGGVPGFSSSPVSYNSGNTATMYADS